MRLAQGRTGWALLAASSFGWSVANGAMFPTQPAAATAPYAADSPTGRDRLAEIKVELAWLADPAVFPCQLAVRASHGRLEIGGQVRGESLHKRVLQLASDHGQLPVVDKLKVLPGNPPSVTARDNNPQLCRDASNAMTRLTAGQSGSFEISADANGQVSVAGSVSSCEEKLKVSRHLSQLPGCMSVLNNLVVNRVIQDGKVHTVVSTDGRLTAPGEPTDLMPVMQAVAPASMTVASPQIVAPSTAMPSTTFMPVQPAKNSPYTGRNQNSAPPANQYGGAIAMAAATPRYDPPESQSMVIYQPAAVYTPPVQTPTAIARGSTYGGAYNPVPPPRKAPPAPLPQATAKVVTKPTSPAKPAPKNGATAVQQAVAKVDKSKNSGIQLASATVSNPNIIRPIPPLLPAQIRQHIETAFRGSVREVTVQATSDNQLQIKVRPVRASEGQTLGKKIINLPELAPYKVDLQMPLQ